MEVASNQAFQKAIRLMLRPIVRYCLRNAKVLQDFIDVAKLVFMEVAEEEIRKTTDKVNVSRLSVMTGLHRKDVTRIFKEKKEPVRQSPHILTRIIGQWEQDSRFTTKSGSPRILNYEGEQSEFHQLVKIVSKNINPATVLFELERTSAVQKTPRGVKLLGQALILGEDDGKGFELLSRDVTTLMDCVEENLTRTGLSPHMHIRTEYDNVFQEDLPQIQHWLREEGKKFHKRARDYISQFDQDVNSNPEKTAGARVVVTAFGHAKE